MPEVWKPSVTVAAIVERGGRFLVIEEMVNGKRVLNQPAGHLDPGESLIEACAREVLEETAHVFAPGTLVGVYRWHYAPAGVTYLRFAFGGEVKDFDRARKLDSEIVAVHWLSAAELRERSHMHRSPLVMRCVEDYLAGRRFPLDVLSSDYA